MRYRFLAAAALMAAGIAGAGAQDYVVLTPENVQSYKLPDTTTLDLLARAHIRDARDAEIGMVAEVLGGQNGEIAAVVVALTTDPATRVIVPYKDLRPQIVGDALVFTTSFVAEDLQALPRYQ